MSPEIDVEITLVAVKDEARRVDRAARVAAAQFGGGRWRPRVRVGHVREHGGDARQCGGADAEMLARIGQTLERAGQAWADVREGVLYVTDVATAGEVLGEMATVFPQGLPAGVVVQTGLVAADGLVELMVTAAR